MGCAGHSQKDDAMTEHDLPHGFSPEPGTVPVTCDMPPRIENRRLLGGQRLEWSGPEQTAVSPGYVNGEQHFLGSCPSLAETAFLAAVEATCAGMELTASGAVAGALTVIGQHCAGLMFLARV